MNDVGVTRSREQPHPVRCAAALRRQAPQQGWTVHQLVDEITRHCGHSRLRAHRLARGWTLATLIDHMIAETEIGARLVPSRISRWERGDEQPSVLYRDALCRTYRTGPVDLALSTDYSAPAIPGSDVALRGVLPFPRLVDQGEVPGRWRAADADDGVAASVIAGAEQLRYRVDDALSVSAVSDATVAFQESIAAQYGRTYKTEPPARFLGDVLADLDNIRALTDQKLPSAHRRDLCAVTARLAGLVSMTMVNLGRHRQARDWSHTARLAADEAADAHLRAWVATRTAVAALHLGDPHAAVTAAREAEVLTRHQPGPITAMAWAIIARAAATMHDPSTALIALRHAEKLYATTTRSTDNTAYHFTAGQLHFYRSHTLTTIGDTQAAWQAQDDALDAFGPGERLDPTLVHLDRALCLIDAGDINQGSEYASTTLLALPTDHRPPIVTCRAYAVATAVPPARRTQPAVRALHEALAITARST